ncbi:hypothetical protein B0O80DRAFT_423695 [Mortierella sp. GBAus27b]|nr:hypothetical protein BGX31_010018 [Mortierella sp. GBA43]KAI8358626.1 hypothetical protein B0O80DRAFT_423695 [Mortierella sp. GBAus27b]
MTFSLKITFALLAVAYTALAYPLEPMGCAGGACHQAVHSGSVSLGSATHITPVTQVTPITRYQPIVQSYAPIVQSQMNCPLEYPVPLYAGMQALPPGAAIASRFQKRDILSHHEHVAGCATGACEKSIPSSLTELGSYVKAEPSNVILPSTIYQGHVKSEAPEIEAAAAQHADLSRAHVHLGAHTHVEPVTKVEPSTIYQPSVAQKATVIEAEAPEYQSLGRSSVSLGSGVTIRPTTTVEPLTVFQPKVKSLPFIISDEGCF